MGTNSDLWEDIKILFSPSEAKISPKEIERLVRKGGDSNKSKLDSNESSANIAESITQDALWGGQRARNAHIEAYLQLLRDSPHSELAKIFGTKRVDLDVLEACLNLTNTPRIEALRLYSGVAYKALGFASLEAEAQDFLRGATLIFSNLFGVVRGFDALPYYHLNQNFRTPNFSLQSLYKAQRAEIDALLKGAKIIIDLRARVYAKAYPLKSARFTRPHFILPLPKGTSHNAKLCRGEALKELAKSAIRGRNELIKTLGEKFILIE